eukprot:PhF_6_TR16792/c0_g1_i1/m.25370
MSRGFSIVLLLTLFGTAFVAWVEQWSSTETLSWCLQTACSVGFGNVTPRTRYGRLCSSVMMFILLAVYTRITNALLHSFTVRYKLLRRYPAGGAMLLLLFLIVLCGLFFQAVEYQQRWTFVDGLYYTVTLGSTVGYGDIAVESPWGVFMSHLMMIVLVPLAARVVGQISDRL